LAQHQEQQKNTPEQHKNSRQTPTVDSKSSTSNKPSSLLKARTDSRRHQASACNKQAEENAACTPHLSLHKELVKPEAREHDLHHRLKLQKTKEK
jgi:hypothetical protein